VVTTLVPYVAICLVAFILSKEARVRILGTLGAAMTAAILVLYFVL
jgi:hypothetical protein